MERSPSPLSPGMQEFIESMGLYFAQYNLPRIGGRILALMMVAERPLSLDDMAEMLLVSRASISTNIRLIVSAGWAEQIGIPGDRRDYYRAPMNSWGRSIDVEIQGILRLQRIVEQGLAAISPDDTLAQSRLQDTLEFCLFLQEAYAGIKQQWIARSAAKEGEASS